MSSSLLKNGTIVFGMKTNVLKPKSLAFNFLTKVPYEAEAGKDGVHSEDGLQWYTCFVNKLEDQKH